MLTVPSGARVRPDSLAVGAILTALAALGQISVSLYIPSLPSLAADLGATAESANLTLSLLLVGLAGGQLLYGPLSDRFGRRRVLIAGLTVYLLASVLCAVAPTIEALIAARILQGLGACAGPVLGRAIVQDVYGRDRAAKALAYIGMAFALSPAVTPIIGGYLQVWFGWRANFVFLAAVAAIVWLAVWWLLAETNRDRDPTALDPGRLVRTYAMLLKTPEFVGYLVSLAAIFAGLMTYVAVSPFVFIESLGLSPDVFGLLNVFNVMGLITGNLVAGRLTQRLGIRRMVLTGLVLALAGGILMVATALAGLFSVAAIVVPLMVFTMGMGIVYPNAMAGAMAPFPRAVGSASALMGFAQMAAGGIVAMAAGNLPHDTHLAMGLVIGSAAAVGLGTFLVLAWRRPKTG